jgi:hypothetical protein
MSPYFRSKCKVVWLSGTLSTCTESLKLKQPLRKHHLKCTGPWEPRNIVWHNWGAIVELSGDLFREYQGGFTSVPLCTRLTDLIVSHIQLRKVSGPQEMFSNSVLSEFENACHIYFRVCCCMNPLVFNEIRLKCDLPRWSCLWWPLFRST